MSGNLINRACGASMFPTIDAGYAVQVNICVSDTHYKRVCFFVDQQNFNHRIWSRTTLEGIPMHSAEYGRLKGVHHIPEKELTEEQLVQAVALAEIVEADPYHGLPADLKAVYISDKVLDLYLYLLNPIYEKPEAKAKRLGEKKPEPVQLKAAPAPAKVKIPVKKVSNKSAAEKQQLSEMKKGIAITGKKANDLTALAELLSV